MAKYQIELTLLLNELRITPQKVLYVRETREKSTQATFGVYSNSNKEQPEKQER